MRCCSERRTQRVGADGETAAVRLEVEQDSGGLIYAAGNSFEAHGDFTVAEIGDVFGDDIGKIPIGLNPVEESIGSSAVHLGHRLTGIEERSDRIILGFANGEPYRF